MSLLDIERSRFGWGILGASLVGAVLFVVYSFVGTFVFGLFLYYSTRPIYRRLRRRIRPPSLAAAVSLFALALPAILLVLYALLIVSRQVVRYTNSGLFDLSRVPLDLPLLQRLADPDGILELDVGSQLTPDVVGRISRSFASAVDAVAFFGVGAIHLFVIIVIAFYLLRDDRRLADWAVSTFGDENGVLLSFGSAVDHDLKTVFFGNILNAVLTGTIGVISYTLLNVFAPSPGTAVPAAGLVGLLAGVASIVPVVGMKLVYVPVAAYMAVATFLIDPSLLWFVLLFVLVSFVVVDTIPDLVLRPYVSGRSLHVGSVMLAYTFGPLLFGWYGIFLMPMLLVVVFHFARIVLPELLAGRAIEPIAVDPGVRPDDRDHDHVPDASDGGPTVTTDGHGPAATDEGARRKAGDDGSAPDGDEGLKAGDDGSAPDGDEGRGAEGADERDPGDRRPD
jgi:predicted PurR-regulated permease PerM